MRGLIVILFALTLLACEQISTNEPEIRPKNVPPTAFWVGGSDGGVYARINESNGNFFAEIDYDSTGEIWYEGGFSYTGHDKFDLTNPSSYAAWDGDTLYLVNGQRLIAKSAK